MLDNLTSYSIKRVALLSVISYFYNGSCSRGNLKFCTKVNYADQAGNSTKVFVNIIRSSAISTEKLTETIYFLLKEGLLVSFFSICISFSFQYYSDSNNIVTLKVTRTVPHIATIFIISSIISFITQILTSNHSYLLAFLLKFVHVEIRISVKIKIYFNFIFIILFVCKKKLFFPNKHN